MKEKLDVSKLSPREYYEILHNGAGLIRLEFCDGCKWVATYRLNLTDGHDAEGALRNLKERLKLGIKLIDKALGAKQ